MSQIDLKTEVQGAQAEPLLPIEKKLIGISLGLGVTLLVILIIVNFLPWPGLLRLACRHRRSES